MLAALPPMRASLADRRPPPHVRGVDSPAREDAAGSRPRRARCRWSAAAKLPKMNNSERGKFYRKKYKDYELQLERDVRALRTRVRELALLAELTRQLRDGLRVLDAAAAVAAALARLEELKAGAGAADARDAALVEWVGSAEAAPAAVARATTRTTATTTRFELEALQALGSADAPVVVISGRVRVLAQASAPPADGGEDEELAAYPCAYRLLFSPDCARHELLADMGVAAPPRPSARSEEARSEVARATAALAAASLAPRAREPLGPRLPGVRQLLRVAAQARALRDGYSSAGTAGSASPATSSSSSSSPTGRRGRLGKRPRAMTMGFILS